ncbi:hypothetical protein [Halobacterium noricense]|uniref:hypothetical protein n=1 Tax=Halobacterium noricense TaxID=223182 RepID=UPI001E35F594|nr:hypothetical protein [Halobacterium noricense]UHH26446.1 hypothetical protein LT974_05790 [Halobacterium noricense]
MSEAEVEGAEEQTEASETGENGSGEQPDIDPDEQADMDGLADLAEQVEEEAGADVDDDQEDTDADNEGAEEEASAPAAPGGSTTNWGDLYVGTVTTGLNAVIDEYGHDDADHISEDLARDLHLDEYVDDWMAEQGKAEMDPAQGMLIATVALAMTVLVSRTDLPSKALSKAKPDD